LGDGRGAKCWETDSRPGLHLEGPQGLIDERMQIADSDVVVGIFWKRLAQERQTGRDGLFLQAPGVPAVACRN
jgi:hypothetical protein